MTDAVNAMVALRSAGTAVLLDLCAGRLPAVVHWGADLGGLTGQDHWPTSPRTSPPRFVATRPEPGVVLPGSVLMSVGLADAPVDPDHAVLYEVTAVD